MQQLLHRGTAHLKIGYLYALIVISYYVLRKSIFFLNLHYVSVCIVLFTFSTFRIGEVWDVFNKLKINIGFKRITFIDS